MSSSDESDEFESADEDIDIEDNIQTKNELKENKNIENEDKNEILQNFEKNVLISNENTNELLPKTDKLSVIETNESQTEENTLKIIESEDNSVLKANEDQSVDKSKEQIVIKGRKLLRKVDRNKTSNEEVVSEVSDEKVAEVLNKLSDLSEGNSLKWNNWLSDIKSAAKTATSTTVSHVSQASNNWSFNPKSLISSAATITSQMVENVSSVVDSAIGAPPPEQMARYVSEDKTDKKPQNDKQIDSNCDPQQSETKDETSVKSGFGFGLFDYTLNTLETIGKKTMEVIADDKNKNDKQK